jgi:hypothetical protein
MAEDRRRRLACCNTEYGAVLLIVFVLPSATNPTPASESIIVIYIYLSVRVYSSECSGKRGSCDVD